MKRQILTTWSSGKKILKNERAPKMITKRLKRFFDAGPGKGEVISSQDLILRFVLVFCCDIFLYRHRERRFYEKFVVVFQLLEAEQLSTTSRTMVIPMSPTPRKKRKRSISSSGRTGLICTTRGKRKKLWSTRMWMASRNWKITKKERRNLRNGKWDENYCCNSSVQERTSCAVCSKSNRWRLWTCFSRKSQATRDDLEYYECQKDMMEQLLDSHCEAERIVCKI